MRKSCSTDAITETEGGDTVQEIHVPYKRVYLDIKTSYVDVSFDFKPQGLGSSLRPAYEEIQRKVNMQNNNRRGIF